jgi:hypothetical protein
MSEAVIIWRIRLEKAWVAMNGMSWAILVKDQNRSVAEKVCNFLVMSSCQDVGRNMNRKDNPDEATRC